MQPPWQLTTSHWAKYHSKVQQQTPASLNKPIVSASPGSSCAHAITIDFDDIAVLSIAGCFCDHLLIELKLAGVYKSRVVRALVNSSRMKPWKPSSGSHVCCCASQKVSRGFMNTWGRNKWVRNKWVSASLEQAVNPGARRWGEKKKHAVNYPSRFPLSYFSRLWFWLVTRNVGFA